MCGDVPPSGPGPGGLNGSGPAGRSRTARRRPVRGWSAPRPPLRPWSGPGGPAAGTTRLRRARRLVSPTITRSVATSCDRLGERAVLLELTRAELDHARGDDHPAATLGPAEPARPGRPAAPLGLELNVSSITHTPEGACAEASRLATEGRPAMRPSATSCGTPSANATASAQARLVGCTDVGRVEAGPDRLAGDVDRDAGRIALRRPPHARRPSCPRRSSAPPTWCRRPPAGRRAPPGGGRPR